MNKVWIILYGLCLIIPQYCIAQIGYKSCGNEAFLGDYTNSSRLNYFEKKSTGSYEHHTIPVVFHIVLNQSQLDKIGGVHNLANLIDSQIAKVNDDFNAKNIDSSYIPHNFKHLYGNAGISFALAKISPKGIPVLGYELYTTDNIGIDIKNGYGSGIAFSNAKYTDVGGIDAWDNTTYLNVWVINPLENNISSKYMGITFSPNLIEYYRLPKEELGIILNYKTWTTNSTTKWRTLTHEIGHYFELRHIWGDDEGKCNSNGGQDDGIDDTPLQANANFGCPTFPKYDSCTTEGNGIMFMNYMDYTDDVCQYMFTKGQVARMRLQLEPYNPSYSLTQHPKVLQHVTGSEVSSEIYPNPATKVLNIRFTQTSSDLKSIILYNAFGQEVVNNLIDIQQGFYTVDLSGLPKGFYLIKLLFANKHHLKKIELQ